MGRYELTPTANGAIGLAMVINMTFDPNNEKYVETSGKERRGSENDVQSLLDMFADIHFNVFKNKALSDLKSQVGINLIFFFSLYACEIDEYMHFLYICTHLQEFATEVRDFKKDLVNGNYSSLFFAIMSHGVMINVKLCDKYLNVYEDILTTFSEREFPEFRGKPKIFFINTCQEIPKTFPSGTSCMDDTIVLSDMLLITPCYPGVKSKRSPSTGSYGLQMVTKVFREKWKTSHIEEMLKEVGSAAYFV